MPELPLVIKRVWAGGNAWNQSYSNPDAEHCRRLNPVIKLSSPSTRDFWEIPVVFEDAHLLALNKPAGLAVSPDPHVPDRPGLMPLLHAAIAAGKPWARERGLTYLLNTHRLDAEISGALLLAKAKPVLAALADYFGAEKPGRTFLAIIHGAPKDDRFEVEAKLAAHPDKPGLMCVDVKRGRRSRTIFEVLERFPGHTLLRCQPLTLRPHQIRVHLVQSGFRLVGDQLYGGKPLWLSRLKREYHLKEGKVERPLISRPALHAEQLALPHPVTAETLIVAAPAPKDVTVALKYLRRYAQRPH